ncbi:MAG: hypothetical protein ABIJ97_02575, partial [Bacteroidota bacterium]
EKRKEKKLERKEKKKIRKQAFDKFKDAIQEAKSIDIEKQMPYPEKFNEVWPFVKSSLEFAAILRITGEKFDNATNEIIGLGDNIFSNYSDNTKTEFNQKLSSTWNKIETALEVAKFIANDKDDDLIDKIIEFGDWLLGEE